MNQQLSSLLERLELQIKQLFSQGRREFLIALWIAIFVLILRSLGLLQSLELATLDQLFQLRPDELPDERITIVAIDEASLRQVGSWPIPDEIIAQMLLKLNDYKPRGIGLDIYKDLPVNSGYEQLVNVYKSIPNLIGIQLIANNPQTSVLPPPILSQQNQVGFNNVVYDIDGKVRRSLLYSHINNKPYESFALKLALLYLKSEGITPQPSHDNNQYLKLGKAVFTRFESNNGGYVRADAKGYQILSNFPKPRCHNLSVELCGYHSVSLVDVLADRVPEEWIRDRIILIGSTAPSLQDFVFIPYSSRLFDTSTAKPVPGVKLQAYFINELISAALQGRPLIKVWSDWIEYLWIFAWSFIGMVIIYKIRNLRKSIFIFLLSGFCLNFTVYLAFLGGWWLPIIPTWMTFSGSAIAMTFYITYTQEELKRSKDFLHQIIDTINDPIFVKNQQYQWIILNAAYCQFIGYSYDVLIEKFDYEFFPQHEVDIFRQQDDIVFQTQQPRENEEEFTAANGKTYLISTKRSLHKDAAGNFFLVGIIRDITQRKQNEEKLKRTAADLLNSNYELKLQENHLRQLAYHDSLTGLSNRKFFLEQLDESIDWSKNYDLMLGLLFIDLDGFKKVNDTLGHEMGDRLLIIIAQRLNNSLRTSDIVSRLGGDEFTVILRAISDLQVAVKVAEKLLSVITEPIILNGHTTTISASIGISIYPINSKNSEDLIKQADIAMYRAKHLGKNRYEFA